MRTGSQARLWLSVTALLYVVAAWRSPGYLHPDEHFQTLELAHVLLGGISLEQLPWEMQAQIRPWLQAFLYAAVGLVIPVDRPFTFALACRLLTGFLAWLGVAWLGRRYREWFEDPSSYRAAWIATALAYFIPVLRVRTSSESLGAAWMMMAIAALSRPPDPQPTHRSRGLDALGGLLVGLAFCTRYQLAFMGLGLLAWMLWVRRDRGRVGWALAGAAAAVGFGLLLDRIGYGQWQLTPWRYAWVNLAEGKAASFGEHPWWAYLGFLWHDLAFPFGLIAITALWGAAWRAPRHVLVWVCVPFVLGHALVGHKELRFLYPYLFLLPPLAVIAFAPLASARPRLGRGVLTALLLVNLWWLAVDRHPTLRAGRWIETWARQEPQPLFHSGEDPFGRDGLHTWLYAGDLRSSPRPAAELGAALDAGESFLFYRYQRRPAAEALAVDGRCALITESPWPWALTPQAWLTTSAGRRMFWAADRHALYRCR